MYYVTIYTSMAQPAPRISWRIEEYKHRDKSPDWFWALGVVAVAGATIAVIANNILFAILILIGALILGYYANRQPQLIDIAINDEGVIVRNMFYPFERTTGFALDIHDHFGAYLLIETTAALMPVVSIPLPEELDYEALAELLRAKMPEKKLKEPFAHRLMEVLGF